MGFQLSVERWISSGQYWPGLCQGGHTLGLEGLLGVKGGDGRGEGVEVLREENIQVVFCFKIFLCIYTFFGFQ